MGSLTTAIASGQCEDISTPDVPSTLAFTFGREEHSWDDVCCLDQVAPGSTDLFAAKSARFDA